MKMIVAVALALVAVAAGATLPEETIKILRSENEQQPDGSYVYSFETENGIQTNELGELKVVNDEDNKPQTVVVVRGQYTYPDKDGKPITVTYFADETGYHAEGDSIPKPVSRR